MPGVLALAAALTQVGPGFELTAPKVDQAPTIDGVVDEREWQGAALASGFLQYLPRRGAPESQPTEALLTYDDAVLYVAFRVWDDREPTAQLTRRDANLLDDDAVVLVLDTYGDRQSAYYFMINLLGTQTDGRIADDGRTVDSNWDGSWRAAATRTEYGWSAEVAIPFSSVSFRRADDMTWGINFGRSRRSTLEQSFWAGPLDNQYRVSQAGTLRGLAIPTPSRRHQVIPYGLAQHASDMSMQWDAGLDARYALRPDVLVQGTLNPDFATIEADREQINLTRFELSFPEKRPFFLEGGDLYRQRIQTFYTRRIADIRGGANLNGKLGAWTTALTWAADNPLPGTPEAHFGVARLQRSIGRSNVALMIADRLQSAAHQGSASVDATLFFTRTLGLTGQWVETYGPFAGGRRAAFVRPSYDSPTGHFHVRFTHLGEHVADNANAVGFIRDDDRREIDSAISKTLFPGTGMFQQIAYNSNYNAYWSTAGRLRSWEIVEELSVELRSRFNLGLRHVEDMQRFEKEFRNRSSGVSIGYNTREYESVSVGYRFGRTFESDFNVWTGRVARKPLEQLSIEYEVERLTLSPDPDLESTWIHLAIANYFFTPDLFLRAFFQTNSALDRESAQVVFVWRYLPPFGTLQVAFQRGQAGFGTSTTFGNTLFLKATTVL